MPLAPALGLLLVECCYDAYNDRWAGDGSRPRLNLSEWSAVVNRFKVPPPPGNPPGFAGLLWPNKLPTNAKNSTCLRCRSDFFNIALLAAYALHVWVVSRPRASLHTAGPA